MPDPTRRDLIDQMTAASIEAGMYDMAVPGDGPDTPTTDRSDCAFDCASPNFRAPCPVHGARPADPSYTPDPAEAVEPKDQLRAVALDLIDTLSRITLWGLHESRVPELAEHAKAARDAIDAVPDPYELGVVAGRKQAAADIRDHIARWEHIPSVTYQERESMRAAARIAEKGKPDV